MRLANPDTVDYLGLEKETGYIVLTLIDDCDWENELQHVAMLQAKINRYLDFVESGDVYDEAIKVLEGVQQDFRASLRSSAGVVKRRSINDVIA